MWRRSGGNTSAVTVETARPACEQLCQHQLDCGDTEPLATCADRCATSVEGWAREDGMEQLGDCISTLACDADDDQCAAMIPALSVHEQWASRCVEQLGACPDFSAQACSIDVDGFPWFRLIVPSIMNEMIACLDEATCDGRLICVEGVFERYHVDL